MQCVMTDRSGGTGGAEGATGSPFIFAHIHPQMQNAVFRGTVTYIYKLKSSEFGYSAPYFMK